MCFLILSIAVHCFIYLVNISFTKIWQRPEPIFRSLILLRFESDGKTFIIWKTSDTQNKIALHCETIDPYHLITQQFKSTINSCKQKARYLDGFFFHDFNECKFRYWCKDFGKHGKEWCAKCAKTHVVHSGNKKGTLFSQYFFSQTDECFQVISRLKY